MRAVPVRNASDRNVLQRLLVFTFRRPEQQFIPLLTNRMEAINRIYDILRQHESAGITDIERDRDSAWELNAAVKKPNVYELKPCRFAVESFPVARDGIGGRVCIVRITQLREDGGSAKSVRFVAKKLYKALSVARPEWVEHNKHDVKAICDSFKRDLEIAKSHCDQPA